MKENFEREKIGQEPDYFLNLDDLEKLEIEGGFERTDPKIQTSMKAEKAHEKLNYLLKQSIELPEDWYDGTDEDAKVRTEYLPCVHTAYNLVSFIPVLFEAKEDMEKGEIDSDFAETLLQNVNVWMRERIEKEYRWREKGIVSGKEINVEAYFRNKGKTVNTNQRVSEEEMKEIRDVVYKRFFV